MHLLKSAIIKYFLDNGLDTMISSSPANKEKEEKEKQQEEKKKTWIGLIDESVHTSDDVDIGDIDAVSRDFVVVKRGFVNVHYYYIPISKVEGWDGHVLWLKITEKEVIRKYERDVIPDPTRYYVKDYPMYTAAYYPELTMIPSRYIRPIHPSIGTVTSTKTIPPLDVPSIYKCDICRNSYFKTEDELSYHVKTTH